MKNGNGVRLAALLLALALCLTACLPAALAQEYAGPSEDEGWKDKSNEWWLASDSGEDPKHIAYELPFKSYKGILINANASMTAPSIEVTGNVETSGSGKIVCAGLLSATGKVSSGGTITAGSLQCNEISVTDGCRLIVKTSLECKGTVTVNKGGTLILPAGFDISTLNLDKYARGTIYVGTKAYKADGTPVDGATIYLTDGCDVSDTGFTWDSATCTLTLTNFTREYHSDIVEMAGIVIIADGKDVTLVLNGTNTLTGLAEGGNQVGIDCRVKSLTLKGGGSLNCDASLAALRVLGGGIQLEDCVLRDGKKIYTAYDGDGSPLGSYVVDSNDAPVASFSLRQNSYAVTLYPNGGTVNSGNVTAYDYGKGVTLPTDVTREGYAFAGWYDNEALTGNPVTAIGRTDEGDKTYWAKWNLIPGDLPVFTEPSGPREVTVRPGDKATLTASATNATTCQWYVNRNDGAGYVPLSGATAMTYTTSPVTLANDGYTYYCEASNAYGMGQSPIFTLRVAEAAITPPQTGDSSHTGLWLALLLLSLGGLFAAGYAARRRYGR